MTLPTIPDNAAATRAVDTASLAARLPAWARELGFGAIGVSDVDLGEAPQRLRDWIGAGRHGTMDYMARHAALRGDPPALLPGAIRVVSVRMDYWPSAARDAQAVLDARERAYVSRYALGRDYHKVMRANLQALADRLAAEAGPFGYRVFCDSAPVMEVAFGAKAGLGWRGKHTLLLSRDAGSLFFLGEIYTDLPLPVTDPVGAHCGSCSACLDACPTGAIVAPYELDARRCISYLTIELHDAIPVDLRPLVGNRIYGCDDCQLACPWNRYAQAAAHPDFAQVRHGLDDAALVDLFAWTRDEFEARMAGSAIRRIGYERWLRNIAVALGNAPRSPAIVAALRARADDPSAMVREHVGWALERHEAAMGDGR
ncbi:MAG TPA: tRNA epoxyqueuosine(34) reductase QueG [Casimicrobiaceae bacterium]|nr:tRNA epoxyqueuosine(34) reductase QueG [Casimicrobiaceae bacterium]